MFTVAFINESIRAKTKDGKTLKSAAILDIIFTNSNYSINDFKQKDCIGYVHENKESKKARKIPGN